VENDPDQNRKVYIIFMLS